MMLFFEILQVAFGNRNNISHIPSDEEWVEIYQFAVKQSLVGIVFSAIEILNEQDVALKPPVELFYQWIGEVSQIEAQNQKLNEAAAQLTQIFNHGGLRTCVLKGQGLAWLYDVKWRKNNRIYKRLGLRRQSGDIDLWVEGSRNRTLQFLKDHSFAMGKVVLHHVDTEIIPGVESEVHFIPGWAYHPIIHHRLQCYYKAYADEQFAHYNQELGFAYPTNDFNAVYCLAHLYMHFLYEGVGMRQIVDYYYVLNTLSSNERERAVADITRIGMDMFAAAVMYVLSVCCDMNSKLVIFQPDEKRGKLLLDEILATGNFGKYDRRYERHASESLISNTVRRYRRQLRFLKYYPVDVMFIPVWKALHWIWRKRKGYI